MLLNKLERVRIYVRRIMMDSGFSFDYSTDRVNGMSYKDLLDYIGDDEESIKELIYI